MSIVEADAQTPTQTEQQATETQHYFDSPRFEGITRLYTARQVVEQRGTIAVDHTVAREAAAAFHARLRELFGQHKFDHHLRPVLPRPGRHHEALRHRGHLPRRLGHLGQGLHHRGSRTRPGQLPAQPGARRGRRAGSRPADRRPQPALPASADDRGAAGGHSGRRLPALHHRRRRHRPRRRSPRAQPDSPLRGGRCDRLPHRGSASRHQEVRPSGRQGAGAVRRADQAAQHRPLPARHHGRARHHRGPHRRRGGQPHRRPRRRA